MMIRIYFPSSMGQRKKGVESTSRYLRKIFATKTDILVKTKNGIPHKTSLKYNLKNLYLAQSEVPNIPSINVGGDHSMAIATVAASLEKYGPNLKVIWFDAHGDINTQSTSPSGNFHGMPLAFLTGVDPDTKMFPFLSLIPKLKFENILYLGVRDLDEGETKVIEDKKIKIIRSEEINKDPEAVFKTIRAFVGKSPVHLSFDVDGIDPEEMPCTGTTAKNGVRTDAIQPILDNIIKKTNLVNMDITEFNLELGNGKEREVSMRNFFKLFHKYL